MAKKTRAEKRRLKAAKIMELKLDGVPTPVETLRKMPLEELHQFHRRQKDRDFVTGTLMGRMNSSLRYNSSYSSFGSFT